MSEIDVSKCTFYMENGSCISQDTDCNLCIHCDCYYKQLQKLKQENDELKDFNEKIKNMNNNCAELLNETQQENEELKEKLKMSETIRNEKSDRVVELNCENIELKQKLEKVNELAKNQDILRGRQALATKILQIIEGEE